MSRTDVAENRLREIFHDAQLGTHRGGTRFLKSVKSVLGINDKLTESVDLEARPLRRHSNIPFRWPVLLSERYLGDVGQEIAGIDHLCDERRLLDHLVETFRKHHRPV